MKSVSTPRTLLLITALAAATPPLRADVAPLPRPVAQAKTSNPSAGTSRADDARRASLGRLRTLLAFTDGATDLEPLLAAQWSRENFRLFSSAETIQVGRTVDAAVLRAVGSRRDADLVVVTEVTSRPLRQLGNFHCYEATATLRVVSPVTNELLVVHTVTERGERLTDAEAARTSARSRAASTAATEVMELTLEKTHKLLVRDVAVQGVVSEVDVLRLMEHIVRLQGVHHVRRLSFDPASRTAVLEVIGSPDAEPYWRAHLERFGRKPAPAPAAQKKAPSITKLDRLS